MTEAYAKAADLPAVIPVFPLDGVLLPPRGLLPLNIFEPRYLNMIDDAMSSDRLIGMVQTRAGGEADRPRLMQVGGAGRITSFAETPDGRYLITLTGVCRFRLGEELGLQTPYRQVRADFSPFELDLSATHEVFSREALFAALSHYLSGRNMEIDWANAADAPLEALVNSLSMALPFGAAEKQLLLEAVSLTERAATLTTLLKIEGAGEDRDTPPALH